MLSSCAPLLVPMHSLNPGLHNISVFLVDAYVGCLPAAAMTNGAKFVVDSGSERSSFHRASN